MTVLSPPSPARKLSVSFEIFPPKSAADYTVLSGKLNRLARWQPEFVSVTCGAGGSAHEKTTALVEHIRAHFPFNVVPHVPMCRLSRAALHDILQNYKDAGIRQVIAVRGDDPATGSEIPAEECYPNTVDFVAAVTRRFELNPIVSAYPDVHPRALSPQQDIDHLKNKCAAGAHTAITQFFFTAETFLRFRDRLAAENVALETLVPGILPIHNLEQTLAFAAKCGTIVPAGFATRFERHGQDSAALFEEGVAHSVDLCHRLQAEGVRQFHFYTLNRCDIIDAVCEGLGLHGMESTASFGLTPNQKGAYDGPRN